MFIPKSRSFLRRIWANTDPITKWIQAVAFAIAGMWALFHWIYLELPKAQGHIEVEADVRPQDQLYPNTCSFRFIVKITNAADVPITVESIHLIGGETELPKLNQKGATFLDVSKFPQKETLLDEIPAHSLLKKEFAAGESVDEDFTFVTRSLPQKPYLFKVIVTTRDGFSRKAFPTTRWFNEPPCAVIASGDHHTEAGVSTSTR